MAPLQIAESLSLAALHAEQIGGARHVDIEESATHEEVGRLGRDVLGKLRQALRRDDTGEPPLAAPAHEIGHGAQAELAGLVGNLAGDGGGEKLRLIHDHEHRLPVIARHLEWPAKKPRPMPHLALGIEALEVENSRDAMLPRPFTREL